MAIKKDNRDFYVYSTKTNNVYYYNTMLNGDNEIYHNEFNTTLKESKLVDKIASNSLNDSFDKSTIPINKNNKISISKVHTLMIGDDGNLYSWGTNSNGQLGIGNKINQTTPQLVNLPNGEKPSSIYATNSGSMVITNKGNLYSTGDNSNGQLGTGKGESQTTFQLVKFPNNEKVTSIFLGGSSYMVFTDHGNIYIWGYNASGQLGTGDTEKIYEPKLFEISSNEKNCFS